MADGDSAAGLHAPGRGTQPLSLELRRAHAHAVALERAQASARRIARSYVYLERLHTGVDGAGSEFVLPLGSPLLTQLAVGLHNWKIAPSKFPNRFKDCRRLVHEVARLGRLDDTARSHQHGLPNTVRVHDTVTAIIVVVGSQAPFPAPGHDEDTSPPRTLVLLPVCADLCHMASLPQAEGGEPVVMTEKW
jgi:hypothetical protein